MAGAALLYFGIVFGAGFVLGPVRIFWIAPRIGTRAAELLETPIMLAVPILAARWVIYYLSVPSELWIRLGMGFIGLGLMLAAEFLLVLRLRGMSIREYWKTRDPVSGTAYYFLLGIFAAMPAILGRRGAP